MALAPRREADAAEWNRSIAHITEILGALTGFLATVRTQPDATSTVHLIADTAAYEQLLKTVAATP